VPADKLTEGDQFQGQFHGGNARANLTLKPKKKP
jgi:hypothetical protein